MNKQRLFIASCISLFTTSMVFVIRGDVEGDMSAAFHLTKEQMGLIWGPAFWGFTISIFLCGFLNDILGMRNLHILSSLGYIGGIAIVLFAPAPGVEKVDSIFGNTGTLMLYVGFLIMGLSQGLVEGVINPLIATIYNEEKTDKLNRLHAWWPGGLVVGAVVAIVLGKFNVTWQIKLGSILIPSVVYLVMILGQEYPKTERVASGVSNAEMVKEAFNPLFLLLFVCMWMTAATELGPDQWFPSIMGKITGLQGVWFVIVTSVFMFVLRFFAGPIAHKVSPVGLLLGCSILSALGLLWLGSLKDGSSAFDAFLAAVVFGIGKTYFWPTMLGVTSERFPKGGSLLMCLMGGAGMLSIAITLPIMGAAFDKKGAGAALQMMAILPVILTFVFGALLLGFKAKGGYTVKRLQSADSSAEPVPAKKSGERLQESPKA
jgi:MFS family permease